MSATSEQRAELAALHTAAGERYAAAVHELEESFVDLLGIGIAASNGLVGAIDENDRLVPSTPLAAPSHAKFLPKGINHRVLHERAHARAAELLAAINTEKDKA